MTITMAWLAVGLINYAQFAARGGALLFTRPKRRDGDARAAGIAEAVFFVLAWPVQLAFWLAVGTAAVRNALVERVTR